jgi:NAD(P)H-flavin reductase
VDAKGYFEIVIKVYRPNDVYPNGGKMSQYLESLKLGDEVDVRGPTGRMVYKRNCY